MSAVDLTWLDGYSPAGFPPGYDPASRTFYSPVDDLHGVLVAVAKRAATSLVIAMYGFDDDELAAVIHDKIALPGCFVQLSLDATQAAGAHEKALLAKADYPATSVAYGHSERNAIMHMKVMIVDGLYLVGGSVNWSAGGETRQDNELTIRADPLAAARARTRIDTIHTSMLQQMATQRVISTRLQAGLAATG